MQSSISPPLAIAQLDSASVKSVSRFRLRAESDAAGEYALLEVPDHIAYLTAPNGRAAAFRRHYQRREPSLLFEPILVRRRPSLLVMTPNNVGMRINGLPAPRMALLRVGDELALDATTFLRIGEYRRMSFDKPPGDVVGQRCGGCRTPVAADALVYSCDCGELLHFEQPPKPEDERLECALVASQCPSCRDELPSPEGELRWGEPC